MLKILSYTGLLTFLQSINAADEYEVNKCFCNITNLSKLSTLTNSLRAGYLIFGGAKKGGNNTKKGVKAARNFDYLTLATKKAFSHLQHAFIQVPILNTLIRNGTSGLKPTYQTMPMIES